MDKTSLLLKNGADANRDDCEALHIAAANKDQKMVDLILPYVSLETCGDKIITQLQHKSTDPAIIRSIEIAIQKSVRQTVVEAAPVIKEDERFQCVNEDTLAEVQPLPDGSSLTMLFNFRTRQQILIKDNASPAVVSFDNLGKDVIDSLREMLDSLANPATERNKTFVRVPQVITPRRA